MFLHNLKVPSSMTSIWEAAVETFACMEYYRCSNLPGNVMMLFSKSKVPFTAIPSNLNGRVSNQKTG